MTQIEFDSEMGRINNELLKEREPLDQELDEIINAKYTLKCEIQQRELEIHKLCIRQRELEQQKKAINIKYHEIKHKFCVANPREVKEA